MITGANRGIGRATALRFAAEGFHVILGCRDENSAAPVIAAIEQRGGTAEAVAIDMSSAPSIRAAAALISRKHNVLDALINNAAVMQGAADSILDAKLDELETSLQVNASGPLELVKSLLPAIAASAAGRIVNVSSTVASIAETANPDSPYAALDRAPYRVSKSVLNMITVLLAKTLRARNIKVNAMCPGWTRTDMGGPDAPRTPEQAAQLAFRLATLPEHGPTGQFFDEAGPVAW
jgi:NAD(P)-dependent dehydrogenase (short-subunit alcohol dehydrogenase family)